MGDNVLVRIMTSGFIFVLAIALIIGIVVYTCYYRGENMDYIYCKQAKGQYTLAAFLCWMLFCLFIALLISIMFSWVDY